MKNEISIHEKINLKYWLLKMRDRAMVECIEGKPLKYLNSCFKLIEDVSKDNLGYSIKL